MYISCDRIIVILITVGMHINDYVASLATKPCCVTDLMLLQKKAFRHPEHHDTKSSILKNTELFGFCKLIHKFFELCCSVMKSFLYGIDANLSILL